MSSTDGWSAVCGPEMAAALAVERFCKLSPALSLSPIDDFISNTGSILTLGRDEELRLQPALGRVLLLGVVSASESYFRNLLARLIDVCPLTRAEASSQVLSLGSVYYYGLTQLGFGLMEGVSFAETAEVRSATKKLTGVDLTGSASLEVALSQYERICQLRHAAAHAHGKLGARNVQRLGLVHSPGRGSMLLSIDLPALHEAAQVCMNTVRAYNLFMFRKLVERWVGNGLLAGVWRSDKLRYAPLFELFHSKSDGQKPRCAYHSYLILRKNVLGSATRP